MKKQMYCLFGGLNMLALAVFMWTTFANTIISLILTIIGIVLLAICTVLGEEKVDNDRKI